MGNAVPCAIHIVYHDATSSVIRASRSRRRFCMGRCRPAGTPVPYGSLNEAGKPVAPPTRTRGPGKASSNGYRHAKRAFRYSCLVNDIANC